MKPLIWIIDEEWPDYEVEEGILNKAFPGCTIKHSGNNYKKDLDDFGKEADAVICQVYVDLPKETIDKLEKCKIIALFGGGYDRIDVKSANEKGIKVTFVPGYCVEDLSDYVMAGIFHCNKKLDYFYKNIKNGLWGAPAVEKPVNRINSSTLLIIGLGKIGTAVAEKAKALNMHVIAYDPYVDAQTMHQKGVEKVEWDYGIQSADFISINTKLTPETEKLIVMDDFKNMKDSAYIINTARGKVVDEKAMIEAVKKGTIAGAVLDVVSIEPPDLNNEIFYCENILVTPHISYISNQSFLELKTRATMNVVKVLNNEEVVDLATC